MTASLEPLKKNIFRWRQLVGTGTSKLKDKEVKDPNTKPEAGLSECVQESRTRENAALSRTNGIPIINVSQFAPLTVCADSPIVSASTNAHSLAACHPAPAARILGRVILAMVSQDGSSHVSIRKNNPRLSCFPR